MSYCLNSSCQNPQNHPGAEICQSCSSNLLLKERYRIIKPLGKSSVSHTFLALDEDQPSQPYCVIKQYQKTPLDNKGYFKLFYKTAKQLDELGKYPAIPSLWASFQQNDRHYLVTQYIEGESLTQIIDQEGECFNEAEIRGLLKEVLPTLHLAHSRKLVHGDIQPETIISRNPDGKYVLVSWGDTQLYSQIETFTGSAEYSAPEQLKGETGPSSDFYSLGVTCLYLLTHLSPFELFDTKADQWVWRDYLKTPISYGLGKIIDKLIERQPKKRYSSAAEVVTDLHSWIMPVPSPRQKMRLAGTALGGALAAIVVGMLSHHRTQPIYYPISTYTQAPITEPLYESHHHGQKTQPLRTLTEDIGPFWSLAVSPDGSTIATGSSDGTIKVWRVETGEMQSLLSGHFGAVWSVAISPDGQTLASAGADKTIKLWNLQTGELLQTLEGHNKSVFSVAFSPNGQNLASASEDQTIKLWNVSTGIEERTLSGHTEPVQSVVYTPDNQTLISGSSDGTVKLWKANNGKLERTLKGHDAPVWSVAVSPDGSTIASGSWDNTIKLWNTKTGELVNSFIGHKAQVQSVAFSPNGQTLASGDMGGTIKIWQLHSGGLMGTVKGHTALVKVAFNPQGTTLISSSFDNSVKMWSLWR